MSNSFPPRNKSSRLIFRIGFLSLLVVMMLVLSVSLASSSPFAIGSSADMGNRTQTRAVFAVGERVASLQTAASVPSITILSVESGESVTFRTHNYPANQEFTVLMGAIGTRGVNGTPVGTFSSGAGGSFDVTVDIPDGLKDAYQVAIRTQTAHFNPYYSFNWFYNASVPVAEKPEPTPQPNVDPAPVYTGVPTFIVCEVSRDSSVTIATKNLPPNQTFTVRMGSFGTAGIGGIVAGSFDTGEGGALNVSVAIPDALNGYGRIAIRAQTNHAAPYYAYNWFYNSNASVC